MWNAPVGYTTFTGPFAVALARGISNMLDDLEDALEYGEFVDRGYKAFDRLTDEQKIWTIHKVTYGLLDQYTVVKDLTAYLEATVASVFSQIEHDLVHEIGLSEDDNEEDCFSCRRTKAVNSRRCLGFWTIITPSPLMIQKQQKH